MSHRRRTSCRRSRSSLFLGTGLGCFGRGNNLIIIIVVLIILGGLIRR